MTCLEFWNQNIPRHDFFFLLATPDPGMCNLLGCGHNSYAQKPLEERDCGGEFSGYRKKKNLQELGRIAPECLNGSMRPQTSYIITPNPARNVFPFFPSELNQDWTSESCLRAPGAGERVGATGFHFPCLDLIDFYWPWEGTQIPAHRPKAAKCLFKK